MWPLLRLSMRTFEVYSRWHGYRLQIHRLTDSPDRTSPSVRNAKWSKVALLREALDRAGLVLWIDADAAVTRFEDDIADELAADAFQALVLEHFPDRVNPNTGVWLLRSTSQSRSFLDRVLQIGQLPHSWADQATVCRLLGWDVGDYHGAGAAPLRPTRAREATSWLSPVWNSVGEATAEPRIRHFAGLPLEQRRTALASLVERLSTDGALR